MYIRYSERADKQLQRLAKGSRSDAVRIVRAIEAFADNPSGAADIKALRGKHGGFLRLRVGDYRVIFEVEGDIVSVYEVKHRQEAYRD
jgi:mRNA interferase RelE/StbE